MASTTISVRNSKNTFIRKPESQLGVRRSDVIISCLILCCFVMAGTAQMVLILGLELTPKIYVMPVFMAGLCSLILVRSRINRRKLDYEREQREFAHAQVQILNSRLSSLLQERTALLISAQDQVALAQTRAEIGAMSAGVIHDISNALMAMEASWYMLEESEATERKIFQQTLRESLDQAQQLTKEFKHFLRPQSTPQTELVEEVIKIHKFLDRSMEAHHQLSLVWKELSSVNGGQLQSWKPSHQGQMPPANLDVLVPLSAGQLIQILLNLIVNARDALGDQPGEVKVEVTALAESVKIVVSDNGSGIPLELQDQIFEPFFTTKGNQGTGLGLHVLDQVVQRVQGQIILESELGRGSSFIITLPRSVS